MGNLIWDTGRDWLLGRSWGFGLVRWAWGLGGGVWFNGRGSAAYFAVMRFNVKFDRQQRSARVRGGRAWAAALWGALAVGVAAAPAGAQPQTMTAAERAGVLLNTARSAFNDGNYAVAVDRFRDYLRLGVGGRYELAAGRYGLGVSLIEGFKDYKGALEVLAYPAQVPTFSDRPYALYYLAVAYRGVGDGMHKAAATQPATQPTTLQQQRHGDTNYMYAAANFGAAADAFEKAADGAAGGPSAPAGAGDAKAGETKPAGAPPTPLEWVARARCDQAEMLIRTGRFKEAVTAAKSVLDNPALAKSRYREQAAYYHGYGCFGLRDYAGAVQSLSTLAPFEQGEFGVHARYLLGRTHHLAGERPEAAADYAALVAQWEQQRKDAAAKLADPKLTAEEKQRLTGLATGPAPDYVARAFFYWGVVLAEFGRHDEAVAKFLKCVELAPNSPVAAEARLRAGEAGVQTKKFSDATSALAPILEHPQFGDQALRWLAKAQAGAGMQPVAKGTGLAAMMNAKPDPTAMERGIRDAVATLKKADERSKAAAATDPQAAGRRAVILLELGEVFQLDRKYPEAAACYAAVAQVPQAAPEVAEQALLRQAIALQLAGDFAGSDKACVAFASNFPRSPSRPEAMVRYAENALLAAFRAGDPAAANADKSKKPYGEAVQRFNRVLNKYPEGAQAHLARLGLATVLYLQDQFAEAAALLAKVPEGERSDDLAGVGLLLADCQLRALPEDAEDALAGARLVQQLENILSQLDAFAETRPNEPECADAFIRAGYTCRKLAVLMADPAEKRRYLARARRNYATVVSRFPDHPLYPVALLENAKAMAAYGSASPAVMELSKFQVEPLKSTGIAPLAMIHLADAMRYRRKPDDAVGLLRQVKEQHEAALLKDPEKAQWVPVMRYSLALSLKEAGKAEEARALFEQIAKEYPKRPEGQEAVWRIAQCEMDGPMIAVDGLRKALGGSSKPDTQADVLAKLVQEVNGLRTAAEHMAARAKAVAEKDTESEIPQKMMYDAAWCWRVAGEVEVEAARRAMQAEALRKAVEKLQAENPDRPIPPLPPPEIALASIPVQPGEKKAREAYRAVIDGAVADLPLVDEARVELAELLAVRDEHEASIALYKEALARDPSPDLGDRLRLRLASMQLARGRAKEAFDAANEILASQRAVYSAYARIIAVEALYQLKDYAGVVEQAKLFVEARPYGRMIGVADHGLLRMAHAQQQLGQWPESRQTLETWVGRFSPGPMTGEAKYALGLALLKLGEPEKAAAAFADVAARNGTELGAKANYQLGLSRLAQKQPADALTPLLTVAYGFNHPELTPAAMCEAAKALLQIQKPAEARRLLERAVKEYPGTEWAASAKKRLTELQ